MFQRVLLVICCFICAGNAARCDPQTREWDPEYVSRTASHALSFGHAERGIAAFGSLKGACISCHRIGRHGGTVGPDLSKIGKERKPEEIIESILWPSRKVADEYKTVILLTRDGLQVKGYADRNTAGHISVRDPATGKVTHVPETNIEEQIAGGTLMPDELSTAMTAQQLHDVVRFLSSLGTGHAPDPQLVDTVLSHSLSHAPAQFPFDLRPLQPDIYPHHHHDVNR
ncbi:MAG: hypothetical protein ABGZ35_04965, partial [Planctomycetaceae bacterium]